MIKAIVLFIVAAFLSMWTYLMAGIGACAIVWGMLGTLPECGESLSIGQNMLIPVMGAIVWYVHRKAKQRSQPAMALVQEFIADVKRENI